MWANQLFYLGVLQQLLCTCLPYGFVGLFPVALLNVFVLGGKLLCGDRSSRSFGMRIRIVSEHFSAMFAHCLNIH
jgi:hypothetical protein